MYMKPYSFQVPLLPLACEQALWSTLAVRREKEGGLKTSLLHRRLLCCGKAGEEEKESAQGTFPSSHRPLHAFYFFDYCYFFRNTQREPLRRREACNYVSGIEFHLQFPFGSPSTVLSDICQSAHECKQILKNTYQE